MLKQRVITAVALLILLVPALTATNPQALAILTLILCTLGAWEWGRLNNLNFPYSCCLGVLCGLICVSCWYLKVLDLTNYFFGSIKLNFATMVGLDRFSHILVLPMCC